MERKLVQTWLPAHAYAEFTKIAKTRRISTAELIRQVIKDEIVRDKYQNPECDPLASIEETVRVANDRIEYLVLAVNGLLKYHESPAAYQAVKDHYTVMQERKNMTR